MVQRRSRRIPSAPVAPVTDPTTGIVSAAWYSFFSLLGNIGQLISAFVNPGGSVPAGGSGVATDITFIDLPVGDWDVFGNISTAPDVTTTQSDIRGWISTISATDPGPPNQGAYAELQMAIAAGLGQTLSVGTATIIVGQGQTQRVYLSAAVTFAGGTLNLFGSLAARQV